MTRAKPVKERLTREQWAQAALDAMANGGLAAVAVEPLAAALGATKGSFYWHFRDRAALVEAALELWVQRDTEGVITALEELPDPRDKMRALFTLTHSADAACGIEAVMLAEANDPQVRPVLRAVTQRRVTYMADMLRESGSTPAAARYRALLAYQTWIGYVQLHAAVGDVMPTGKARAAYLKHVMATLEGGLDR